MKELNKDYLIQIGGLFQTHSQQELSSMFFNKEIYFKDQDVFGNTITLTLDYKNRPTLKQIPINDKDETYVVTFSEEDSAKAFENAIKDFLFWLKDFSLGENEIKDDGSFGTYPKPTNTEQEQTKSLFDF